MIWRKKIVQNLQGIWVYSRGGRASSEGYFREGDRREIGIQDCRLKIMGQYERESVALLGFRGNAETIDWY
jgi:hypothetical protein